MGDRKSIFCNNNFGSPNAVQDTVAILLIISMKASFLLHIVMFILHFLFHFYFTLPQLRSLMMICHYLNSLYQTIVRLINIGASLNPSYRPTSPPAHRNVVVTVTAATANRRL